MQKQSINIYFPNLNGLRFIAALFVFVCHVEAVKGNFNLPSRINEHFFLIIGKLGVVMFFVLSGFLITYLLLSELKETNTIAVKKFYLRRILRIWPLYFLIVFFSLFLAPRLAFFQLPNIESALNTNSLVSVGLLFIFMLPNYVYAIMGTVPYAAQNWSIGTEEQFYLLWPVLIKKVKNKPVLFGSVFILYSMVKLILIYLQHQSMLFKTLLDFWYYFNIDCMALGAMGAYLVIAKKDWLLRLIYSIPFQIAIYLTIVLLIGFSIEFRYMHFEIYGALFACAIINLATNKKNLLSLENPVFNYLGKISYGIYMYHFIALTIAIRVLIYFDFMNDTALYLLGFILTIALSSLSYYYFESFFLKFKQRFSLFSGKRNI
ncbi:MAG: acyltransferase [Bacteroidetes bacterium]|nr:acyltransferase [Bacteroidota bacterium]MBS1758039.1 acyltransferase [Bacteroidota bacterium]